jgi:hypothetical protein
MKKRKATIKGERRQPFSSKERKEKVSPEKRTLIRELSPSFLFDIFINPGFLPFTICKTISVLHNFSPVLVFSI